MATSEVLSKKIQIIFISVSDSTYLGMMFIYQALLSPELGQ